VVVDLLFDDRALAVSRNAHDFKRPVFAWKVDVKKLSDEKKELSEKLEDKELSENFKETLMLSESNKHGFEKGDEEAVVGFMKTLSEDQRKTFSDIVAKVKTVDLSTIGTGPGAARAVKFSSDAVAELADKLLSEGKAKDITEAQKMATKELQTK